MSSRKLYTVLNIWEEEGNEEGNFILPDIGKAKCEPQENNSWA